LCKSESSRFETKAASNIRSFVALSWLKKMEKTAALHVGKHQKQSYHHSYKIAENLYELGSTEIHKNPLDSSKP
jgi:hypothetical protein